MPLRVSAFPLPPSLRIAMNTRLLLRALLLAALLGLALTGAAARGAGAATRATFATTEDDAAPQWSPDGSKIAFSSRDSAGHWQIYTVSPTGGSRHQLTH